MHVVPFEPVVIPLEQSCSPSWAFSQLSSLPFCLWLDSALASDPRSQYSFLTADPVAVLSIDRVIADPLATVEKWLAMHRTPAVQGIPPFQGGVAGYMAYEFGRCFERIPPAAHDEFELPLAVLGLYDVVLAWEHATHRGWLISQGFDPKNPNDNQRRRERAEARAREWMKRLETPSEANLSHGLVSNRSTSIHAMAHGLTAPQFETRLGGGWLGNFDSHGYRDAVQKARDYIRAGDIFQVNLSQRLLCPARCDAKSLYLRLREVNSAPFASFFDMGTAQLVSASPERFLQVREGWVETRPIKGTRRRIGNVAMDLEIEKELMHSPKDRSENIMIVDLLRNDLSRICDVHSLSVDQLCSVEAYPFVLHLVSSIRAKLREGIGFGPLMASVFPGGSITGAPKIRAMEIIAELEPTARGPYCGSLGYAAVSGDMDWNILIRTLTASRGWWQFQVGGGIVADSIPELEEEETWTKAAGIVAAIDSSISTQV
ncbi:MAG: anthranilate synthase component I family protein [Planctomycetota bacterium]